MQTHWHSDKDRLLRPVTEPETSPFARMVSLRTLHRIFLTFFFAGLLAAGWLQHTQPAAHWPVGVLLGLAAISTLVSSCRTLPAQNVLAAAAFILVISAIVQTVGTVTSIPFGPYIYTDAVGDLLFDKLPWMLPLVWLVVILNCRGVARLILRPWRKVRTYGYRVIGLTCLLVMLFDFGLEPFATRVNLFWVWQPTNFSSTWFGAPWINFFGWAAATLLILAFATPWLINKKPGKRPPDHHPLVVWLALNLFFAAALSAHQLWAAVIFILIECAVIVPLAISNARW